MADRITKICAWCGKVGIELRPEQDPADKWMCDDCWRLHQSDRDESKDEG